MDMPDDAGEEATVVEGEALQQAWAALGPLVAFAIKRLGQEAGIKVCNGLAFGVLVPIWTMRPGIATCAIRRGNELIYEFQFEHNPARFVFHDIGSGAAN